ncbi:MAG: DUF1553 domain-containing protein [Planctomycetes bacterium]|nr:DUF1553 domain-containing protein [Planctomycetota bacterium]
MNAHHLATLLAATLSMFAVADAGVAPDEATAAALPLDRVVALEVHPAHALLDGRYETAQLVVRGRLDDGQWIDCTRDFTATLDGDVVHVDARARLLPQRDGDTTLTVRVGANVATIPVTVRGVAMPASPSFTNDVTPMMSRLGCNAGTCHGSAKGKNGFKLSLRGYDPNTDHEALTDELAGRRFNRAVPEQSLFLLKPTASVPHEGGQRLVPGSREYQLLVAWVAAGAPLDESAPRVASIELWPKDPIVPLSGMRQQFAVHATYTDGRVRDVTSEAALESNDIEVATADATATVTALRRGDVAILARYAGRFAATRMIVMGDRSGFDARASVTREDARPDGLQSNDEWIDALVDAKLAALKTAPSGPCSDAEFVRRLHLDLTGAPPTIRETRAFLLDRRDSRQKRDELIDRLIGSVEFVEHWTNKWADLLQVNSKFLGDEGATRLRDWIREQVASNRPYDEFAAEVLGASGSTYANPPAAYWKILRQPDVAMENTTQLFLGVRFSCNKCHDHPFERWTQDQHWQLAAFFAQVARENVAGSPMMPRSFDNRPDDVDQAFEEMVKDAGAGDVMHPNKNVAMEPTFPYDFARVETADVPGGGSVSRREQLVSWITARENPYFAKSYANRIWSYFLGVGLIEPIDDLRASNPPTNPELLDRLTASFLESGFDVRALMRRICRSATYQRSLATDEWNADDTLHYAHATARRLPAETLFDAIQIATGRRAQVHGARPDSRAAEFLDPSVTPADGFLALFGRPPRESACECERGSGLSLGQALHLVNGPTLAEAIDDPASELSRIVAFERNPRKLVDELYLRFLARPATDPEFTALAPGFEPNHAANVAALPPTTLANYQTRRMAWEAAIPRVSWQVIDHVEARSDGGATFTKQPDGSLLVGGTRPDTDTTTLLAWTDLAKITALRLEAIPDAALPSGGSGRSDSGNFVLSELKLVAVPLRGGAGGRTIALQNASADFSQMQFDPGAIADGNGKTGWAIYPHISQRHQAVWEFAEDAGGPGGTLLVITLEQGWGSGHNLGRFRLSLAGDARPVRIAALPDEVLAALAKPAEQRAPEHEALIHQAFLATAPDLREAMRMAAMQDVAWALATSPAFLFNR